VSGKKPKVITVFTHAHPGETVEAVERLIEVATAEGVQVRVPTEELAKHSLEERPGTVLGCEPDDETDLAVVFGGDGTVFTALRTFAGRGVPVLAFNYGTIGFLATFERSALDEGLRRALSGDFEVLQMPALAIDTQDGKKLGVNDISFHRRPNSRVAELAYSVGGEQLGEVRCDGLVASTPVGSTGYNLANGGPVLAWGVEGFVVSFIAPHTLTARVLVVAPDDVLTVLNLSPYEAVYVTTDGRNVDALEPGRELDVTFEHDQVLLAQVPGASFYHRFREKFGRLAY
jgi:NAD+ kinase